MKDVGKLSESDKKKICWSKHDNWMLLEKSYLSNWLV